MSFAAPQWLWLCLAAPLAAAAAGWCWRRRLAATAAWAARPLWDRLLPGYRQPRLWGSTILLCLAVLGIVLALARPRWGGPASRLGVERFETVGPDVVFVLDTSLSMATRDLSPNRLWVAQTLIRRLVRELAGSRLALVQAEGAGVVMVPLTTDGGVIELVLDAVQPGSLPVPGTELAPALHEAVALFPADGDRHRVVVLVSDGEDHGAGLDRAAGELRRAGVVVHALGVGTLEGKPLEMPGEVEYKRDADGRVVVSRLREDALEALCRGTGGLYLRATGAAADLAPLGAAIRAMETRGAGGETVDTRPERFQWPLALAIAALVLQLAVPPFRSEVEV